MARVGHQLFICLDKKQNKPQLMGIDEDEEWTKFYLANIDRTDAICTCFCSLYCVVIIAVTLAFKNQY